MGLGGILFTAFEPSGDAIAASLITALRRRGVQDPIYALGGPQMAASGAELIETTTQRPAMLGDAAVQFLDHWRRLKRLGRWMGQHELAAVVPTDSPAANWSICKLTRRRQGRAKIVHLVAPHLWAWASWRIRKLRRLTDHVLCVLPFEPAWFEARGVKATFVGHPIFDREADDGSLTTVGLPQSPGSKLVLLPGSRASEIRRNWPTMLEALRRLAAQCPDLSAIVAVRESADAERLWARGSAPWPSSLNVIVGRTDDVLSWADAALVVSGTVTLQAAAHGTPMVALYNLSRWSWHLVGWWLMRTRTFTLPNLIGESIGMGRVVPEFVPHFGQVAPVVRDLGPLLNNGEARRRQRAALTAVAKQFEETRFAESATSVLLETIGAPR